MANGLLAGLGSRGLGDAKIFLMTHADDPGGWGRPMDYILGSEGEELNLETTSGTMST